MVAVQGCLGPKVLADRRGGKKRIIFFHAFIIAIHIPYGTPLY
jgi:hypothetical protein